MYSKDRNKGLIKILRDGSFKGDKTQIIEYITDQDFREFFIRNMNKQGIIYYDSVYKRNTILEIENIFK